MKWMAVLRWLAARSCLLAAALVLAACAPMPAREGQALIEGGQYEQGLGKLEEAMFLMEAQNNSGTIDVTATVTLE